MKYWKGQWIVMIACLHSFFALWSFDELYKQMLMDGLWQTVNSPTTWQAAWFFLFGILLFVVGSLIMAFEKNELQVPRTVVYGLLVLAVLGATLMPVSGFWLLFPPVGALMLKTG